MRRTTQNPRELAGTPGTNKNHPILHTRTEAAKILRCSLRHIDHLRQRGELRATVVGARVLFLDSELQRFIAAATEGGAA